MLVGNSSLGGGGGRGARAHTRQGLAEAVAVARRVAPRAAATSRQPTIRRLPAEENDGIMGRSGQLSEPAGSTMHCTGKVRGLQERVADEWVRLTANSRPPTLALAIPSSRCSLHDSACPGHYVRGTRALAESIYLFGNVSSRRRLICAASLHRWRTGYERDTSRRAG